MIANGAMTATSRAQIFRGWSGLLVLWMLVLGSCSAVTLPPGPPEPAPVQQESFVAPDGFVLPMREWLPPDTREPKGAEPWAVVLALHGFNDSRDAWEIPGPDFAKAGIAVFAPDQRGFGATATRGHWPGTPTLVRDAADIALQLHRRYPHAKLFMMGESMGAAVLMVLAASHPALPVDGWVLVAPAVWGRAEMNVFLRSSLWLAATFAPGLALTGNEVPLKIRASDNRAALIRLTRDPLTLHRTRMDTLRGLVDLMDAALAAAPRMPAHTLFLYGGHDDLVPPKATTATWEALPGDARTLFFPDGYHLLLRDEDRAQPINDVIAWMRDPAAPAPDGADGAARAWLEKRVPTLPPRDRGAGIADAAH